MPWAALSAAQRAFVVEGDGGKWYGVRGFFEWLEGRRYKVQARITIARYRRFDPVSGAARARGSAPTRSRFRSAAARSARSRA